MKKLRILLTGLTILVATLQTQAQTKENNGVQYTSNDSIKVEALLSKAAKQTKAVNWMLFFARQLRGIPYMAKTLEANNEEKLIVNLRQLDCTTYVENVLALTLCMNDGKTSFHDYCQRLRLIRYKQGEVGYPTRLHYFTQWIEDNTLMGFVKEKQTPNPPFTAIQTLNINFMTTNTSLYPMFNGHPEWVKQMAKEEQTLNGKQYRYIPKEQIKNNFLFRSSIHDGDIIAITTTHKGLDTSHIGIAVWHPDGLHLLNASQIRKKVVEEPMTLYTYMQKHPSQVGIRIIGVCQNSCQHKD